MLQDLGGPKIRIGKVADADAGGRRRRGSSSSGAARPGATGRVSCAFDALFTSVTPGDRLLIDDGRIELEAHDVTARAIADTRAVGRRCCSRARASTCPTSSLKTSALTAKDREDLSAGIAMGVDMVAVSFVQSPQDVVRGPRVAAERSARPTLPIVAKIEKPQAVDGIDGILDVADGADGGARRSGRRDPARTVPAVQRRIVQRGAPSRGAGDSGDAGARVDAHRTATDARGSDRRGARGG